MTEASYEETEEEGAGGQIEPIHVVIDRAGEEVAQTPEFGSWHSFSWAAGATVAQTAQPIVPQSRMRSQAEIWVYNGPAAAAGAYVQFGTQQQVQSNSGAQIQGGTRITYEAAQQLWISSDGVNAMIVTVLDQRYL